VGAILAWGLVAPLVTKADGTKFGKTESGNVWLDAELTPPYVFYQFWLNCDDGDAGRYLRYFTFVPVEDIEALEAEAAERPQERPCQKRLALELTALVHGDEAVASAVRATRVLFEGGDLRTLSGAELRDAFHDTPSTSLGRDVLGTDEALLTTLVASAGLESSRGQARRAVQSGAISINGQVVKAIDHRVGPGDLVAERYLVLRRGKKTYHLLEFA
jgi:tyrosyl-tRNA synthetase